MSDTSPTKTSGTRPIMREVGIMVIIGIIMIGGFFGANLVLKLAMGNDTPLVVVSSGSMEPNLNVGDICIIQNRSPNEIQIGDIIVFQATWLPDESLPVIHRVKNITQIDSLYYFVTQGDNTITNPFPDPASTPESHIDGVVIFTFPRIGVLILWLNEGSNYLLIIGFLVGLIAISFVWDYIHPDPLEERSNSTEANDT